MKKSTVLAVEVSVSQKTIDTLLSRKTLEVLLPRSLPDDVLVELWRSLLELQSDPTRKPAKHDVRSFAASWVRVMSERADVSPERVEHWFWDLVQESLWLVGREVAYRVSNGLCDDDSRADQGVFVRWLRIVRRGGS
jgi:hypothetical protein